MKCIWSELECKTNTYNSITITSCSIPKPPEWLTKNKPLFNNVYLKNLLCKFWLVLEFSTEGWRIDNIKYPIDFYDYGLSAFFFFLEFSKLAWMICHTTVYISLWKDKILQWNFNKKKCLSINDGFFYDCFALWIDYKSNNDTLNVLFNKKFLMGFAIVGANVFYFNQLQTWNQNGMISRK